jgi:hypothetical protein
VAVAVYVDDAATGRERVRLLRDPERDRVLSPLRSLPVCVLEPRVGADEVQVAVTVHVAQRRAGVHARADVVSLPRGPGVPRDPVPPQVVPVRHRRHTDSPVARQVAEHQIVNGRQVLVENDSFKCFLARLPGVAIPGAAADVIDPPVAVHVEREPADVRRLVATEHVAHPVVGPAVLEPEDVLLRVLSAGDEVEVAVLVDVGERRLAVAVAGEVAVDVVVGEAELGAGGHCG